MKPRTIVVNLAVLIGFALLVETCSRVVYTFLQDDAPRRQGDDPALLPSARMGWVRKPGFRGLSYTAPRAFDADGYVTADSAEVASGRPRIVLVADSTGYGNGVATSSTYAEQLEKALGTDVINLAVPGYSSFQGLRTFEGPALALRPTHVIVSFNFNDRRGVEPGDEDQGARFARVAAPATRAPLLESIHTYLFLQRTFGPPRQGAGGGPGKRPMVDTRRLVPRVSPERYRQHLDRMATLGRERGVQVVFLLLSDSTDLNVPPEALDSLEARRFEDAVTRLTPRSHTPVEWLRRRLLSLALEGAGRERESQQARMAPRGRPITQMGGFPVRTDREYNAVMREVAQHRGVPLVDAAAPINARLNVYIDQCHFNETGHQIIADLLARTIRSSRADVGSRGGR